VAAPRGEGPRWRVTARDLRELRDCEDRQRPMLAYVLFHNGLGTGDDDRQGIHSSRTGRCAWRSVHGPFTDRSGAGRSIGSDQGTRLPLPGRSRCAATVTLCSNGTEPRRSSPARDRPPGNGASRDTALKPARRCLWGAVARVTRPPRTCVESSWAAIAAVRDGPNWTPRSPGPRRAELDAAIGGSALGPAGRRAHRAAPADRREGAGRAGRCGHCERSPV
jgi:hypothetical protein